MGSKSIYEVTNFAGKDCIIITQDPTAVKTLKNDIENVVATIAEEKKIDPKNHLIVYNE